MTNKYITNRDLYDAINGLRKEVTSRIEKLEVNIDENTNWRNQITGKIAALMIFVGVVVNWFWDRIFNNK